MAARRVVQEASNISTLSCPTPPTKPVDNAGENRRLSNLENGLENENPGALAGATGADVQTTIAWLDHTLNRIDAASGLRAAVLAIPADDRVPFLEAALAALEPDWPGVPFNGPLVEARDWATWASLPQREALTLACFETLPAHRQAAFLAHVAPERRAAA